MHAHMCAAHIIKCVCMYIYAGRRAYLEAHPVSSLPALPVMHDGRGLKVVAGTEGEAWEGEDSEAEDNKDNTGVLLEGHCAGESGGEGGPAGDDEGGGGGRRRR